MNIFFKKINILAISFLSFLYFKKEALASNLSSAFNTKKGGVLRGAGFRMGFNVENTSSLETIIASVISFILSFLGIIFIVLAIYAGVSWMMAGGNEKEVEKAQQTLKNAILGLVIVLASYALSWLILNIFVKTGQNLPN